MTDASLNATNAPTPTPEMDALIATVAELTELSAEMTRLCIAVQRAVPTIALSRVSLDMTSRCLDLRSPPLSLWQLGLVPPPQAIDQSDWIWTRGIAATPEQLEASFPPGVGHDLPWQVVCIGCEPGLYASADEANSQITGVPNQFRQKKSTRLEALAFYRHRYNAGKVQRWNPVAPEAAAPSADAVAAAS
ncbi:hypothetical protein DFH09DRAFT_1336192 [Mycena vulgaris]|nr:hypothetical protein DFH09DRAFT_1336192 [Mycena vulgaris]